MVSTILIQLSFYDLPQKNSSLACNVPVSAVDSEFWVRFLGLLRFLGFLRLVVGLVVGLVVNVVGCVVVVVGIVVVVVVAGIVVVAVGITTEELNIVRTLLTIFLKETRLARVPSPNWPILLYPAAQTVLSELSTKE